MNSLSSRQTQRDVLTTRNAHSWCSCFWERCLSKICIGSLFGCDPGQLIMHDTRKNVSFQWSGGLQQRHGGQTGVTVLLLVMLGPNYPEDRIGVTFLSFKAAFGNEMLEQNYREDHLVLLCSIIASNHKAATGMIQLYNTQTALIIAMKLSPPDN